MTTINVRCTGVENYVLGEKPLSSIYFENISPEKQPSAVLSSLSVRTTPDDGDTYEAGKEYKITISKNSE